MFGKKAYSTAEGAGIPVVNSFMKINPHTNFLITGVLGPEANGHGPNEFLHIPYTKKLTRMIALVVGKCASHYKNDKWYEWILKQNIYNECSKEICHIVGEHESSVNTKGYFYSC